MTFDELWRRGPAHSTPCTQPIEKPADFEILHDLASDVYAFDDLDDAEIDRFIEWLEENV